MIYANNLEKVELLECIVCGLLADPIEIPAVPSLDIPSKLLLTDTCQSCRVLQSTQQAVEKETNSLFERWKASGIPKRFSQASFKTYIPSERTRIAYEKIYSFDPGNGSLFMYGPPGTGKTHLSAAILSDWLKKDSGVFISVPDLIFQIKRSFFNGGYFQYTERMQQVSCLVLDDIGAERLTKDEEKTAFVRETLYSLVNSRYQNQKSTIFTSNFNQHELEDKLGKPIISRIVEMSRIVKLEDDDYRFKIRKNLRIIDNNNY